MHEKCDTSKGCKAKKMQYHRNKENAEQYVKEKSSVVSSASNIKELLWLHLMQKSIT